MIREALFYEKLENNLVHCYLCNHHCRITDSRFGFCGVRQNIDGVLYTYAYRRVIAAHVDPVEKKPLYHFLPGTLSFSFATVGCNFHCGFCQNWEISQQSFSASNNSGGQDVSSQELVNAALRKKCRSISYTYTEPTIFFEYAYETARLAKTNGLYNIFVTNGYMTRDCIEMIKPYLEAANVDLKFFNNESYQKVCAGKLKPILDSIGFMHELGIWVEVTTLLVPGENDSEKEIKGIAEFIASIDKNMPWHISRFYPDYKFMNHATTSEEVLKKAEEVGRLAGLNYIYIGNVPGLGNDTLCHSCNKVLIKREAYNVLEYNIKEGKCAFCNAVIPGVFS